MTYRILVCDDDREIARAICIYLRSTGYEAVEAHVARKRWSCAARRRFICSFWTS